MNRGIYAATAGMMTMLARVQTISNNLANVNTAGYREDTLRTTTFPQQLMMRLGGGRPQSIGAGAMGVVTESVVTRFTQGSLRSTENSLDMAINGDGFFAIQTAQGVRYTRDGSFRRDGNNQLVTGNGDLVLSPEGTPITLPPGLVTVANDGQIRVTTLTGAQTGPVEQVAGRLGIYRFADQGQLRKVGNNLFEDATGRAQAQPAAAATVHQGYLENANVDPVRSMSDIMVAQRTYEASARMVQLQDDITARAVSEIGRL